jgi:uncharacterized protein YecT (DUF1311 family)
MRAPILAIVAIHVGLTNAAIGQNTGDLGPSIKEMLPLFDANHCGTLRSTSDLLFCGDPALNALTGRLNTAIRDRLDRVPNRRLAIEENAEWARDRDSSCGILRNQSLSKWDVQSVKACLLKETEERIDILADPNFDCLATNTTASLLICSDPVLTIAKMELNSQVVGLIAKLKGNDAKQALAEYERWSRERDRKCDLVDKDNVPLDDLSPAEDCLAEYINQKSAEITIAKGDPKRIFGRHLPSPSPDAVDLCVAQIHSVNTCEDFLAVNHVRQIDREVAAKDAVVRAEVEMKVLSPFAVCSPIASGCTGKCWDLKSVEAKSPPGSGESLPVAHRLKIQKSFAFQKTDSGGWRCDTAALQPVEAGFAMSGP